MKKSELLELGVTEEQAEAIATKSAEELKDFVPKARLDEVIAERNALKTQMTERDAELEALKKSAGDNEALQKQITELQEKNTAASKEFESTIANLKLDNAVELALAGAKARNTKAVKALLDLSKAKVGEDGTVAGLEDQLKALRESDAYLFAESQQQQPQLRGVVPQDGAGSPAPKAVKDMTYTELCDYMAAGGKV